MTNRSKSPWAKLRTLKSTIELSGKLTAINGIMKISWLVLMRTQRGSMDIFLMWKKRTEGSSQPLHQSHFQWLEKTWSCRSHQTMSKSMGLHNRSLSQEYSATFVKGPWTTHHLISFHCSELWNSMSDHTFNTYFGERSNTLQRIYCKLELCHLLILHFFDCDFRLLREIMSDN